MIEGDREHRIETELNLVHTLLDMLEAGQISPEDAEACYQDFVAERDTMAEQVRALEEIFAL